MRSEAHQKVTARHLARSAYLCTCVSVRRTAWLTPSRGGVHLDATMARETRADGRADRAVAA